MGRYLVLISIMLLPAWGCGPPEIVPVLPPGLEYREVVPEVIPESEQAQALGESRGILGTATEAPQAISAIPPAEPTEIGQTRTMPSGVTIETLEPGNGAAATAGQTVTVHYTGTLENGTIFDSSRTNDRPFTFRIGSGEVIRGWDYGITGMKVGERRKLTIPPQLAYGSTPPTSKIPPNATLIFEVELIKVE